MAQNDADFTLLVVLLLNLFILSLAFLLLLVILVSNRRLVVASSKLYYFVLSILMLSKLVGYLVFGIKLLVLIRTSTCDQLQCELIEDFELAYKNSILATDMALIQLGLIILQVYLRLYAGEALGSVPRWVENLLKCAQVSTFGGYLVLLVLYNVEEDHPFANICIGCAIFNLASVLSCLLLHVYLNIRLTGRMTDPETNVKLKGFVKLQFWVFLGRAIEGVCNILLAVNVGNQMLVNFIVNIEKSSSAQLVVVIGYFALFLVTTLVTEGITLGLSVRSNTVRLLTEPPQSRKNSILKASMYTDSGADPRGLMETAHEFQDAEPSMREFELEDSIEAPPNSLGTLKKGIFRGRLSVVREIHCELSKYVIEEVNNDVDKLAQLNLAELLPVRYCIIEGSCLYLVTDFYEANLNDFIKRKPSLKEAVWVAYRLAVCVQGLHQRDMPHGTLKTTNAFLIQKDIKLGDYGLLPLKKFLKLTQGYTNKSVYTAPQILGDKSLVVERPTKAADVYAVGMIMYELFTGNREYRDLSVQELETSFRQQEVRPKIPGGLPSHLANLVRNCWQQDPKVRPGIENVVMLLGQYCRK